MAAQSPKKPAAKKPAAKKTSTQKKPAAKTVREQPSDNASKRQTASVLLFAGALFLLCVTLIPSSVDAGEWNLWEGLRNIIFGLFGACAFALPLLMIYIAIVLARGKSIGSVGSKLFGIGGLAAALSSLIHVSFNQGYYLRELGFGLQLTDSWKTGADVGNGGIIGAVLGGALAKVFGKTGAIVTILILVFVLYMLLTGTTLLKIAESFKRLFGSMGTKVRDNSERRAELARLRALEAPEDDEPAAVFEEKTVSGKAPKKPFNIDVDLGPMPAPALPDDAALPSVDEIFVVDKQPVDKPADEPKMKPAKKAAPKPAKPEVPAAPEKTPAEILSEAAAELENPQQYRLPPISCLSKAAAVSVSLDSRDDLAANGQKLVDTLKSFNVETKIVDICRGPSVTRYEIQPAPGVKISKITGLADDIAMNLAASAGVRIEAPIPNKNAVGIEVPNRGRSTVTLREIISTEEFKTARSRLNVALGRDITGNVICADLAKMPHLLIAGTTGSGKSVCLNSMIVSILYNATPDQVKLVMIDPKQVEFTVYKGIPHLIVPVVADPRKAAGALGWAVTEMLGRYKMFAEKNVRDIAGYNKLGKSDPDFVPMYHIVIFIDELSDLMMAAPHEVEDSICRLAQMARAAGMHLVIATQRPSVDVITGIIKANIPSRIALSVSSQVDSRTILDVAGAEKLLGYGDMLFNPVGISKPVRVQGCFVSDEDVESVVEFIKSQEECTYDDRIMQEIERQAVEEGKKTRADKSADADSGTDEKYKAAVAFVIENQVASTTLLQRKLNLGFSRAGRIMDQLEERGIVGPQEGSKPRKVLMSKQEYYEMNALNDNAFAPPEDATDGEEE